MNAVCATAAVWLVASMVSAQGVCPEPPAAFAAGTNPTFAIDDAGGVQWLRAREGAVTEDGDLVVRVDVHGAPGTAMLRVGLVHPSSPGVEEPLGCGSVNHGDVIRIDGPDVDRERPRLVRFSFFRRATAAEDVRFEEATRQRREALRERSHAGYVAFAADRLVGPDVAQGLDVRGAIASLEAHDFTALGRYLTTVSAQATRWRGPPYACSVPAQSEEPFRDAVCVLTQRVLDEVAATTAAAQRAERALAAPGQPADVAAPHLAEARARLLALERLREGATDVDPDALCGDVAELRWIQGSDHRRFVTAVEAPWTDRRVYLSTFGRGSRAMASVDPETAGGVIVTGIPGGVEQITFRQRVASERLASSPAVVFPRFFRLLAGLPGAGMLAALPPVCGPRAQLRATAGLPPIGAARARAHVLRPLPSDRETLVDVCAGRACVADGQHENIEDTLRVTPRSDVGAAVLLEGAGAPLSAQLAPGDAEWAYERQRYVAWGGTQGPEQLYRLEGEPRIASLFTLSALLGLTFRVAPDRSLLLALGVTLLDGDGRRSFLEGSLRFGVEVCDNVFFTTGPSIASIARRVEPGQADAVAVPRTGPGVVPNAPPLEHGDALVFRWSVGLAVDFAIFGAAADEIAKAVGGGDS